MLDARSAKTMGDLPDQVADGLPAARDRTEASRRALGRFRGGADHAPVAVRRGERAAVPWSGLRVGGRAPLASAGPAGCTEGVKRSGGRWPGRARRAWGGLRLGRARGGRFALAPPSAPRPATVRRPLPPFRRRIPH